MAAERNDDGRTRALREVARDYPGWQVWPAVLGGLLYTSAGDRRCPAPACRPHPHPAAPV